MCNISKKTVVKANRAVRLCVKQRSYTAATAKDTLHLTYRTGGTVHRTVVSTKELNSAYAKALEAK